MWAQDYIYWAALCTCNDQLLCKGCLPSCVCRCMLVVVRTGLTVIKCIILQVNAHVLLNTLLCKGEVIGVSCMGSSNYRHVNITPLQDVLSLIPL